MYSSMLIIYSLCTAQEKSTTQNRRIKILLFLNYRKKPRIYTYPIFFIESFEKQADTIQALLSVQPYISTKTTQYINIIMRNEKKINMVFV